jgi:hypothetical protein
MDDQPFPNQGQQECGRRKSALRSSRCSQHRPSGRRSFAPCDAAGAHASSMWIGWLGQTDRDINIEVTHFAFGVKPGEPVCSSILDVGQVASQERWWCRSLVLIRRFEGLLQTKCLMENDHYPGACGSLLRSLSNREEDPAHRLCIPTCNRDRSLVSSCIWTSIADANAVPINALRRSMQ